MRDRVCVWVCVFVFLYVCVCVFVCVCVYSHPEPPVSTVEHPYLRAGLERVLGRYAVREGLVGGVKRLDGVPLAHVLVVRNHTNCMKILREILKI